MTHGEIIKQVLELRGMTVTQLGKESGINRHTIYTIVNKNQQKTTPRIYVPISQVLKIPENFFTNDEITEDDIKKFISPSKSPYHTKGITVIDLSRFIAGNERLDRENPEYFSDMMSKRNISINEIFAALQYTGLHTMYSFTDLANIIENPQSGNEELFDFVEHFLIHGNIIDREELSLINKYRLLDTVERDLLNNIIQNLFDVKTYIDNKWNET